MAKAILVANWKNNPKSISEAKVLLKKLARDARVYKKLSLFIAPPAPFLDIVGSMSKSFAGLSSQDMPLSASGTHTGMVTPDILKSLGVRLSIIGHSERRAAGETSVEVLQKVRVALKSGIIPLVCVGETSHDQDGEHFEFLREQLKTSLAGLKKPEAAKLLVAYEPSWAIGKTAKDAMKSEDLSQSIIFIRKVLVEIFGRSTAEKIPILYGGSVETANAGTLFRDTSISGFLVGHDSRVATDFKIIAESLLSK